LGEHHDGEDDLMKKFVSLLSICVIVLLVSALCIRTSQATPTPMATPLAVAYAHVLGNGTLDQTEVKNVVKFYAGSNGVYCFKLSFAPANAVATIANDPTASQGLSFVEVALAPTPMSTCPGIPTPNSDVTVFDSVTKSGTSGHAFYVYWTK
jgi:hypothetical protein